MKFFVFNLNFLKKNPGRFDTSTGNNLWLGLAQQRGANCEVLQKKTNPSISQRCQGPFAICRGNNLTWEVKSIF